MHFSSVYFCSLSLRFFFVLHLVLLIFQHCNLCKYTHTHTVKLKNNETANKMLSSILYKMCVLTAHTVLTICLLIYILFVCISAAVAFLTFFRVLVERAFSLNTGNAFYIVYLWIPQQNRQHKTEKKNCRQHTPNYMYCCCFRLCPLFPCYILASAIQSECAV